MDLTPVQLRNGLWLKREDLYSGPYGINGSKLRACQHLLTGARAAGYSRVVTACSVLSPQAAMVSTTARDLGLACTVIYGGTRPSTAFKHPSPQIAQAAGAQFDFIGVGYNPALQRAARNLVARDGSAYLLEYGITTPPSAGGAVLNAFHAGAAEQVANLPAGLRTLVIPFGSGNTATGVLSGIVRAGTVPERVVLVGIGPDRRAWLARRAALMGFELPAYEHIDLHTTGIYGYADKQPYTLDGVVLHPTYEGKVAAHLDKIKPVWWTARDGSACLWIVGGPL